MATAFCTQCGKEISADARFCKFCGASQELAVSADPGPDPATAVTPPAEPAPQHEPTPPSDPPPPPPPPPPPQTQQPPAPPASQASGPSSGQAYATGQLSARVEQAAPGAGELAGQLAAQLATPGVAAAGIAALLTMALMLVAGLVMAIIGSNSSLFLYKQGGLVSKMLLHVTEFTGAPMKASGEGGSTGVQTMPMLFLLLPLGGMAVFTALQRERLSRLQPLQRLIFAAAGGLLLAVMVLVIGVSAKISELDGSLKANAGSAFLLALLWGSLGGALGAAFAFRREPGGVGLRRPAAPWLDRALTATRTVLRPLLIGLGIATAIGTALVLIQTFRLHDQSGRSKVHAAIENALYAPEHGTHVFELGSFAQFKSAYPSPLLLPIPVKRADKVLGSDSSSNSGSSGKGYRVFDYSDAVTAPIFIVCMLLLIALPLLLALYAGFAAARAVRATRPEHGAAWGALTGPVWAFALLILNGVANKTAVYSLWGLGQAGSVFGFSLLIGAALGALGGFVAAQSSGVATAPSS